MSFIRQAIHCRIINTVTTDFWLAMTLLRIQICRVIKWWTLPHLCHGTGSTKHEEKDPLLCRLSKWKPQWNPLFVIFTIDSNTETSYVRHGYSKVCSTACSYCHKKTSIEVQHYWIFARGIHRWPLDSPPTAAIMRKTFLCHDVIMCNEDTVQIVLPRTMARYTKFWCVLLRRCNDNV